MSAAGSEWLAFVVLVILVIPAGPNEFLIPMLAVAAGFGVFRLAARTGTAVRWAGLIALYAVAGGILVLVGALQDTDGWTDVAVPLVAGPIAWAAISLLATPRFSRNLARVACVAAIALAIIALALITKMGRDAVRLIEPGAFGRIAFGRSRINFVGITSLLAIVPMLLSLTYDRIVHRIRVVDDRLLAIGLLLGLATALASGRQGVIGVIAISPLLFGLRAVFGLGMGRRPRTRHLVTAAVTLAASVGILASIIGLSPISVVEDLASSVGLSDSSSARVSYSASVRERQSASLLSGFAERPLVGNGAGAVSPDFPTWRGIEPGTAFTETPRPWRAELSYQLLLFEGGLVGALAYLATNVLAARTVVRSPARHEADRVVMRAAFLSALAMLVGSAAGPHLRAVGAQLLLFLPLIVAVGLSEGHLGERQREAHR